MKGAHQGSVSKIVFYSDGVQNNLILSTGLKDGRLTAHDMRMHRPISSQRAHNAAINFLGTNLSGYVITGSADKTLNSFDIFNSCKPVAQMKATDAVFCGEVLENLVVVGCGDGNILCFDTDSS